MQKQMQNTSKHEETEPDELRPVVQYTLFIEQWQWLNNNHYVNCVD